jgi:hypothetical protein
MAVAGFDRNPQNINKKGRPKEEWTMSGLIRDALEEQNKTGEPKKKVIARKLAELASLGDIVAIKEVNNRIDGQSPQAIDMTTQGEKLIVDYGSIIGLTPTPKKTKDGV